MKYMLMVVAGVTLSSCAMPCGNDAGNTPAASAESSLRLNTFEVFFDYNRSTISETAAKILRKAADSVKQGETSAINVSVYTDSTGLDPDNQALAARRAEAVKAELIKDGVPATEIFSVIGRTSHLVATQDGVHEPQNRRTEIILR